jgi:hypothetical protein
MSIIAVAAMIGFSVGTMPILAGAQIPPPMPSPTDDKDKDKKPGSPRAGDDQSDSKKKDERDGR